MNANQKSKMTSETVQSVPNHLCKFCNYSSKYAMDIEVHHQLVHFDEKEALIIDKAAAFVTSKKTNEEATNELEYEQSYDVGKIPEDQGQLIQQKSSSGLQISRVFTTRHAKPVEVKSNGLICSPLPKDFRAIEALTSESVKKSISDIGQGGMSPKAQSEQNKVLQEKTSCGNTHQSNIPSQISRPVKIVWKPSTPAIQVYPIKQSTTSSLLCNPTKNDTRSVPPQVVKLFVPHNNTIQGPLTNVGIPQTGSPPLVSDSQFLNNVMSKIQSSQQVRQFTNTSPQGTGQNYVIVPKGSFVPPMQTTTISSQLTNSIHQVTNSQLAFSNTALPLKDDNINQGIAIVRAPQSDGKSTVNFGSLMVPNSTGLPGLQLKSLPVNRQSSRTSIQTYSRDQETKRNIVISRPVVSAPNKTANLYFKKTNMFIRSTQAHGIVSTKPVMILSSSTPSTTSISTASLLPKSPVPLTKGQEYSMLPTSPMKISNSQDENTSDVILDGRKKESDEKEDYDFIAVEEPELHSETAIERENEAKNTICIVNMDPDITEPRSKKIKLSKCDGGKTKAETALQDCFVSIKRINWLEKKVQCA